MDPVWPGKKDKTWFELEDFEGFMMYLGRFRFGEEIELIVRKRRKRSSDPQRRYYYGVVLKVISDYTGHTTEELDNHYKQFFLGRKADDGIVIVPSKNDLSTVEMTNYIEAVRASAAVKLGLNIPNPNQVNLEELDNAAQEDNKG